MGGGEIQPLLDWLQPDQATENMSDADMATLRAFGFTRKGTTASTESTGD